MPVMLYQQSTSQNDNTTSKYCMCIYFSGIHILAGISTESNALIHEYANMSHNNEL